MKKINLLIFFLLGTILPILLLYHSFFSSGALAFGDAPYFYPENLKELFNVPFLWLYRNDNFGVSQQQILWLYLPTFFLGLLNQLLGLNFEVLIRVIFYFPSVFLSLIGTWLFASHFTKNNLARFFASIFYTFNTYILTLIDGGQIGMALSYGLFPQAAFSFLKFWEKPKLGNFWLALLTLFLLSNSDLRIFLIEVFFVIVIVFILNKYSKNYQITKSKIFLFLFLMGSIVLLDAFWIVPFISYIPQVSMTYSKAISEQNFVSLIDSFFLFQPHFPLNEFGKTFPVPISYSILPILILSFLFFRNKQGKENPKKWYFLFSFYLFFVFLSKGFNSPFGIFYQKIISLIPLGSAFRDSSKFFIPAILLASLLLAYSIQNILGLFKNNLKITLLFVFSLYFYLLWLIQPAILGDLTGVLGKGVFVKPYFKLEDNSYFYRTLWFPERLPTTFATWGHPSLSASDLYKERPFASIIEGDYDFFGFLHNDHLDQWLNLLGVKYIFLPENQRKKIWTQKDKEERGQFLQFVSGINFLKKLTVQSSFPIYKVEGSLPHIFGQQKVFIVLGGEQIYNIFFSYPNFNLAKQAIIFLEQGNFDPRRIFEIDKNDADIIFFGKNVNDLPFIFLQKSMLPTLDANFNEWAKSSSVDYLKWKSALFQIGISSLDFDFGKGLSYSTIRGERIRYSLKIKKSGDYILALRYANSSKSGGINIKVGSFSRNIKNNDFENFHWDYMEISNLSLGSKVIEITNLGGGNAVNTVMLVDKVEYLQAVADAQKIKENFNLFNLNDLADSKNFQKELDYNFLNVDYTLLNPTQYKVNLPKEAKWLTFSDHFDQGWELEDSQAYPFYAMINGFYLKENNFQKKDVVLLYKPQKIVTNGVLLSLATLFLLLVSSFGYYLRGKIK